MAEPTTKRAYSIFEIKAADPSTPQGKRTFSGIATTPSTDSMGDIVEPMGAQFKLPIPLLWQHDSRKPIGWVTNAKLTDKGIYIEGEVASMDEEGCLKDRLDEAWQSMKAKLVKGLSIGFQALESTRIEGTYSFRYVKWMWLELSAVTIPANADCSITAIKSADQAIRRAASGARPVVRLDPGREATQRPGVSGSTNQPADSGPSSIPKGTAMNIAEQLTAFATKRAAALDRANALMAKAADEGRTLDDHEAEEHDNLTAEVKQIDKHIDRLKTHEATMVARAAPIGVDTGRGEGGIEIRGSGPISVRRNVDKGIAFTRYAKALAIAKNNPMHAELIARQWRDSTPEVEAFIKAGLSTGISLESLMVKTAVAAGTTSDTTWAGPLVYAQNMVSEFIEYLRPQTILGRLPGLRKVPFNVRLPRQTSGISGSFVGEGLNTPVQKPGFDSITLTWARASTIVVLTKELVERSDPSAEALVRSDLAEGISAFLDKRFIDPSYAGVSNVSPASVSNGVTSRQASGSTLAAVDADVAYVKTQFVNAEIGSGSIWVMSPSTAITLSMMRTAHGDFAYPEINEEGGRWYGRQVITSNNVTSNGSPGEQQVFLLAQPEILLSDDGQMMIDMSSEASLQMNDAPSAGAQSLVSLWQTGGVGVKLDRWINWSKRRSAAVQYIEAAQRWGS